MRPGKVPRNWANFRHSVTTNFRVISPKDFRAMTRTGKSLSGEKILIGLPADARGTQQFSVRIVVPAPPAPDSGNCLENGASERASGASRLISPQMSPTAVAFCCLGMRKFYGVGGFAPPGAISLRLTASLATVHRRILAAFRQKIHLTLCSKLPSQFSLKHANCHPLTV
jgi:hypothetical protein